MGVDDQDVEAGVMNAGSGRPPASRRAFLTGTGAAAGVAAVAGLFGGPLAETARAAEPGGPLPSYAPIPKSALGPPLNADGYFVGQIQGDLYWVTDSAYQAMFLTTKDGVVIVDAPDTIGHNLLRAIGEVTRANGRPSKVTGTPSPSSTSPHASSSRASPPYTTTRPNEPATRPHGREPSVTRRTTRR
jgi:hypothetical protein